MRTITATGVAFLLALSAAAQHVPDRLNYQAVLTDSHGQSLVDATNTVRFRVYDEPESGTLIWGETHSVTTSPRGLFSVVLGAGTSLGEKTDAADLRAAFASATLVEQRYLELQVVNQDGTAQSPILPRQRFLTVPYVFQANDAQNAANDFTVSGALYTENVGMNTRRLLMTNSGCSATVGGDLRVAGDGYATVTASFASNSFVRSTAPDALRAYGNLSANGGMTVGGGSAFYRGVAAEDPVFNKGATLKGGVRALGAYKTLYTSVTTNLPSRKASGDGFLLVYFKTDGWNKDAELDVTAAGQTFNLRHENHSSGDKRGIHFYDTACIPVPKDSSWSIAWSSGDKSDSSYDVYWIPFGY